MNSWLKMYLDIGIHIGYIHRAVRTVTTIRLQKFFTFPKTLYPLKNSSPFSLPIARGNHQRTFYLYDLATLDTSYERNHMISVILRLAYYIRHSVSKVHSYFGMCQNFLLLRGLINSLYYLCTTFCLFIK